MAGSPARTSHPDSETQITLNMDIKHLRTFLEVARTRHFGKAADNLCVTQSAVSARIRLLESTLGVELFTRTRNDIQITAAGQRLLRHAESIVGTWSRARQEAGLGPEFESVLAIGGVFDLWPIMLDDWLAGLPAALPSVALQAEAYNTDELVRRLVDDLLDLVVLFEPPQIPDIGVRQIGKVELVLVSSAPGLSLDDAMNDGYIMIDWGISFSQEHARRFPDLPAPAARIGLGSLGLAFLRRRGGAAYLPESVVSEDITSGHLFRVSQAPAFERDVFALYRPGTVREPATLTAITRLQQCLK